jgi:uncharacterized protein HemX
MGFAHNQAEFKRIQKTESNKGLRRRQAQRKRIKKNTDRQVLMSDSEDNSVTHEQEVQALIDELTGTDLQYSEEDSSEPFLQQEDSDE